MRGPGHWSAARALAAIVLAAASAGCADFLATPASGARVSLSLQPPGPPAHQVSPDTAFDAVDGLSVRVYRRQSQEVLADSFAVSPAGGVIRQFVVIPVEGEEETLELVVELHADGQAVFAGAATGLRLVRGGLTTVEVELVPVSSSAVGAGPAAVRGAANFLIGPGHPRANAQSAKRMGLTQS